MRQLYFANPGKGERFRILFGDRSDGILSSVTVSVQNIIHVVSNDTLGVFIAWQKIPLRSARADCSKVADEQMGIQRSEINLILTWCKGVPFSVKASECFFFFCVKSLKS